MLDTKLNNPLRKFGELLRSNEEQSTFKDFPTNGLSSDVRKDIVYSDSNSPLTHYWSYYFINECEDWFPFEDLILYYRDTTKPTLTNNDFENIFKGKDKEFNKWFDKIKPFLHPLFKVKNIERVDVTPNNEQ